MNYSHFVPKPFRPEAISSPVGRLVPLYQLKLITLIVTEDGTLFVSQSDRAAHRQDHWKI